VNQYSTTRRRSRQRCEKGDAPEVVSLCIFYNVIREPVLDDKAAGPPLMRKKGDAPEVDLYASVIALFVNQYSTKAAKPPPMREEAMHLGRISMHLL
jgi:hypothetical protein